MGSIGRVSAGGVPVGGVPVGGAATGGCTTGGVDSGGAATGGDWPGGGGATGGASTGGTFGGGPSGAGGGGGTSTGASPGRGVSCDCPATLISASGIAIKTFDMRDSFLWGAAEPEAFATVPLWSRNPGHAAAVERREEAMESCMFTPFSPVGAVPGGNCNCCDACDQ